MRVPRRRRRRRRLREDQRALRISYQAHRGRARVVVRHRAPQEAALRHRALLEARQHLVVAPGQVARRELGLAPPRAPRPAGRATPSLCTQGRPAGGPSRAPGTGTRPPPPPPRPPPAPGPPPPRPTRPRTGPPLGPAAAARPPS